MRKLLKLKIWITIVLLNCSINLLASNTDINASHPSTGDVVQSKDSVTISYNDLRLANSKLIELKYEKQINNNLRSIISNDRIIIRNYRELNTKINKDCKKAIRQRNIGFGCAALFLITSIILLVK